MAEPRRSDPKYIVFVAPAKADAFGKYVIADRPPPVGSDELVS